MLGGIHRPTSRETSNKEFARSMGQGSTGPEQGFKRSRGIKGGGS